MLQNIRLREILVKIKMTKSWRKKALRLKGVEMIKERREYILDISQ